MSEATADRDPYRRDWRAAFGAIHKLFADANDTAQVFVIMRALNGAAVPRRLSRLSKTPAGALQLQRRRELAPWLSDPKTLAGFAPGTLGVAYRDFLALTGYSAAGLVGVSKLDTALRWDDDCAWISRRTRDVHDIWHVLTGYKADESLGEASLVAFSFAQAGGLGWGFIACATALKSIRVTGNTAFARSVWEGFRNGRKARWLLAEDYETLLGEPIDMARTRLGIVEPLAYRAAQRLLARLVGDGAAAPATKG